MTYSKAAPVVNPPKSKNLPLSLAVSFIIILFLLIFQDNATVIPILGFHGVINNKNSVTQLEEGRMHYPQKNLERFLEYLLINDYW
ncbi:polysaccharide deacetylase, partial [Fischerella thermalis CCMEE 5198]